MSVEEIRKYRDLLESVLMEAQNYEEMFSAIMGIFKEYPDFSKDVESEVTHIIQKSKAVLKTKDKIVWFLRQARLSLLNFFIINAYNDGINIKQAISNNKAKCQSLLNRYINQIRQSGNEQFSVRNIFNYGTVNNLLTDLEHYLSLPIPEIQNYNYNYQSYSSVVAHFKILEDEWKKTVKDLIPFDPNDGEAILSFNDGFAWYNLNREYCRKEGDAMGHCGNAAAYKQGDKVLSLRKKVKVGNELFFRPSLTFILHANGMLGEMKGRANNKPKPEYHSHIIALLRQPFVKGIEGGGYASQNNFKLSDLDINPINILLDEKPELLNHDDLILLVKKGYKPTGEILTVYKNLLVKEWISRESRNDFSKRNHEIEKAIIETNSRYAGEYLRTIGIPHADYPVELQLLAVEYDFSSNVGVLSYIKNPSEEVQLAAVQKNGVAIQNIRNPSEEVQLAAIEQAFYVIQYIKEPTHAAQLLAVKEFQRRNPEGVRNFVYTYINNPSDEVKRIANGKV